MEEKNQRKKEEGMFKKENLNHLPDTPDKMLKGTSENSITVL